MTDIAKLLYDDASVRGIPLGGTFELTPLCNMNCKMCYIRMTKEEMERQGQLRSAAEWLTLAEKAKAHGMLFLLLTGGEPLLYPEFDELYAGLKRMGFFVSINSNAVLLEGERLEKLIQNPPYKINITLYGGSDETYADLCRCKNGFTKATAAIKALKEAGVYVKINGSITPHNCRDIDACFSFARQVNAPLQLGSYMFPPMRRENQATGRFDAVNAGKYQAIIDKTRYSAAELEKVRDQIRQCEAQGSKMELPARFRCRAGRSSFWINWKGEMTPCGMMETFTQHPFAEDFGECWQRINRAINGQTALENCTDCPKRELCKVCPAMAYSETGSLNEKPRYVCEMTESWMEEMMK